MLRRREVAGRGGVGERGWGDGREVRERGKLGREGRNGMDNIRKG